MCKLHKSLNGLKQAPRQWNKKLTNVLLQLGFTQSHFDYSLFTKMIQSHLVVVLVYVDDLLVTSSNSDFILQARNDLQLKSKIKYFGELKFFLVARSFKEIVMSQRKYDL